MVDYDFPTTPPALVRQAARQAQPQRKTSQQTYAPFCSLECNREYSAVVVGGAEGLGPNTDPWCLNCGEPVPVRNTMTSSMSRRAMSTLQGRSGQVTAAATIYVGVDMDQDLHDGYDSAYMELTNAYWDDRDAVVNGVVVPVDKVDAAKTNYVSAWEDAWVAAAKALGYEGKAVSSDSDWRDWISQNTPENLDTDGPDAWGESAMQAAWQSVWDAMPVVTFSASMVP